MTTALLTTALEAVCDDLKSHGYQPVAPPDWLDWAADLVALGGALTKVVGVADYSAGTAEPTPELCRRFEEWSTPLRGHGGMAILLTMLDAPHAEEVEHLLTKDREWYCGHVTRVVYDANSRIYWFWQPATGIQRSERPPV